MNVSYAIPVCNEHKEIEKLLSFLVKHIDEDDEIIVPSKPTMDRNEASQLAQGLVSTEDMFIYQCVVGSAKRSLKCFEFKFKAEDNDIVKDVEEWITAIQ